MIETKQLTKYINKFLNIYEFNDYGPNGIQVLGNTQTSKIAFAVSATKYSIDKAVELKADTLIVHHGLFWKFHGPKTITGAFYQRIAPLIKNDINLLGYHLPLDAHLEVGNAMAIAKKLQLEDISSFGDHKGSPTGIKASLPKAIEPDLLRSKLKEILGHEIIHSCPNDKPIKSIGIITGGANSDWRHCIKHGLDAYLTGEISEHDWHEAQEENIHFFAGGHNATEQFGVQELMKHLHDKYQDCGLEFFYIPSHNPA
ncbi:MAG: Nif3-like dinuclear metal center hexameric protein [Halobacteriovoraceae bacterium]|jgi:dinuclear metal center YbgI/SA1388 family protein|nr:Nif3-like dinuclear metal center hexameric protein [Halobacteriovoraceae bacterium]